MCNHHEDRVNLAALGRGGNPVQLQLAPQPVRKPASGTKKPALLNRGGAQVISAGPGTSGSDRAALDLRKSLPARHMA